MREPAGESKVSKQNELELNSASTLALTGNALGHEFGHQDYGTLQLNGVRLVNEAWLLGLIEQRDNLASLQGLDELRRSCAEILGQDPETWPPHGNAPLAIASALALAVSTTPQPAPAQDVAESWRDGYRAAMNSAASGARQLYVQHCHHHGVNGLLDRSKELEQSFLREADNALAAHDKQSGGGA